MRQLVVSYLETRHLRKATVPPLPASLKVRFTACAFAEIRCPASPAKGRSFEPDDTKEKVTSSRRERRAWGDAKAVDSHVAVGGKEVQSIRLDLPPASNYLGLVLLWL